MGFLRDLVAGRRVGTGVFLSGLLPYSYTIKDAQRGLLCGMPGVSARTWAHTPRTPYAPALSFGPPSSAICPVMAFKVLATHPAFQGPCLLPSLWEAPLVFLNTLLVQHCSPDLAILCCFLLSLESEPKEDRHIDGPHHRTWQFACNQGLINIFCLE